MNDLTLDPTAKNTNAWKRAAYLLLTFIGVIAFNILLYKVIQVPWGYAIAEFFIGVFISGIGTVCLFTEGKESDDHFYAFSFLIWTGFSIIFSLIAIFY